MLTKINRDYTILFETALMVFSGSEVPEIDELLELEGYLKRAKINYESTFRVNII